MSRNVNIEEDSVSLPTTLRYFSSPSTGALSNELEKKKNKKDYSLSQFYSYTSRLETFTAWSTLHPLKPEKLAQAGFCYTGLGDICICPWCERLVTDWKLFDEPFSKHKEISSVGCSFLDYIFPTPTYIQSSLPSSPKGLVIDETI